MATIEFDHVTKRFDDGTVAVDSLNLVVVEGEFLIFVGPSGCGKTTALRMVAGLEEISSGEIRIGDQVVNDVQPSRRDVAMVFQNYALYPHMTVFENISFPLRQQHLPKGEIDARVKEAARFLSIEDLLARKPKELSGGQRQRVAMGRAIVRKPQAFLMDEPLSNLDAKLRVQMRAELISLHHRLGITTVYVTHDQTEAMTLGDRVVVLNKGVVQQVDPPEQLYRRPANTFVAGFIGSPSMNFLQGELAGGVIRLGRFTIDLPDDMRSRVDARARNVLVGVRPEDFDLTPDAAGAEALPAEIEITEQLGSEMLAHFRVAGLPVAHLGAQAAVEDDAPTELSDTLVARFEPSVRLAPGQRAMFQINRDRIQLFDPESGQSLHAA
jgi:multiple sugar transport system ATP-binding protein